MKYTIEGFQQQALLDLELDGTDAIILRWFVDFKNTGKMEKKIIDNTEYFWIKYSYIIEQLPILGIKQGMLQKRFKKYKDVKIMLHKHITEKLGMKGSWSFWTLNPEVFSPLVIMKNKEGSVIDYRGGIESITEGVCNRLQSKDSSISNSSISNSNNNSEKKISPIINEKNSLIEKIKENINIKDKGIIEIIDLFTKKIRKEKPLTQTQANNSIILLQHLFKGTFTSHCTNITLPWITKSRIPPEWLNNKKWSVDEIKNAIINYSLQFKNGFWPYTEADKKKLNKDLSTFLYNSRSIMCPSVFLKMAANKPKRTEEQSYKISDEKAVNILNACFEKINMQELDNADKNKIIKNVDHIIAASKIFWEESGQFYSQIGPTYERVIGKLDNYYPMLETLTSFLYKRNGDIANFAQTKTAIKIDMAKPGTKTWTAFKQHVLDNYELNLTPRTEEKEKLKAWSARVGEDYDKRKKEKHVPDQNELDYNEILMKDIYKNS